MINENLFIGAGIGLVVALVLSLVLNYTLFKDKQCTLFYILVTIVCVFAGAVCYTKLVPPTVSYTPQEQMQNITAEFREGWKNTNGGFDFKQIETANKDSECPTCDDKVITFNCYDYGAYVGFSYSSGGHKQNILFVKTEDGLVLDGVLGVCAEYQFTGALFWKNFNLETFKWQDYRDIMSLALDDQFYNLGCFISLSSQRIDFTHPNSGFLIEPTNRVEFERFALEQAGKLVVQNALDNFVKFGDVELIGDCDNSFKALNSYYNYLYQSVKGVAYGGSKLIDCKNILCVPIPEREQENYPISQSKQADYDGAEYYGVYNCDIATKVTFLKGIRNFTKTPQMDKYFETIANDKKYKDITKIDNYKSTKEFCSVKISFVNTSENKISDNDFLLHPVNITFIDAENHSKVVTVNSNDALSYGFDMLFVCDSNVSFSIESDLLVFDNFLGSFNVKSNSNLKFNYYYLNNYTNVSVGLHAVGNIDFNNLDLHSHPVKIMFFNSDGNYEFLLNDNKYFDQHMMQYMKLGTYDFTILSDALEFSNCFGTVTFTTTDRTLLFNCSGKINASYSARFSFSMEAQKPEYLKFYSTDFRVNIDSIIVEFLDADKNILETKNLNPSYVPAGDNVHDWYLGKVENCSLNYIYVVVSFVTENGCYHFSSGLLCTPDKLGLTDGGPFELSGFNIFLVDK